MGAETAKEIPDKIFDAVIEDNSIFGDFKLPRNFFAESRLVVTLKIHKGVLFGEVSDCLHNSRSGAIRVFVAIEFERFFHWFWVIFVDIIILFT